MSTDPIMNALGVRARRAALFLLLTGAIWLGLWSLVMVRAYDVLWTELHLVALQSWPPASNITLALLWWGCCVIAVQGTTIVYLVIALWWRKSGDVHRRGTRFIDRREDY